jgi:PAS domain S-box-containing protein
VAGPSRPPAPRFRSVLDTTSDAVSTLERDTLRLTYVNQGAIDQLGYGREELLSMNPLHIKPIFSVEEFRAPIDSLSPGQSHSYATVRRLRDGPDVPLVALSQHPADDLGGGSAWMVSIIRDRTQLDETVRRLRSSIFRLRLTTSTLQVTSRPKCSGFRPARGPVFDRPSEGKEVERW